MKNKKKLIIIGILLLIAFGLLAFKIFEKEETGPSNVANVVDSIKDYGYTLDDRDNELYREEFSKLKNVLNEEDIDYEEYAKLITKMFIIDFYSLANKINKYDIGGLDFIHTDIKENFGIKAGDTLYKYLEDDSDHNRKQELPEVKEITYINVISETYKLNNNEVQAYKTNIKWTYDKALGYDTESTIYLIKNDKKLEIVEIYTGSNE